LTRIRSTIGAISGIIRRVKYWEIIAGKVSKPVGVGAASQQWIPTGERSGLQMHIAYNGKRFVVRADEKLTAFLELERVTRESFRFQNAE
jgi:hypothetical protein